MPRATTKTTVNAMALSILSLIPRRSRVQPHALVLALALALGLGCAPDGPVAVAHPAGGSTASVQLEVVSTPAAMERGLMYRKSLPADSGMLFVFPESSDHSFWMKNTLIPLSIAFMRADGTITDIDEMQAETTNNHCPKNNGVYALEMSKGWFTSKGIKPGMKIQGLPAPQ